MRRLYLVVLLALLYPAIGCTVLINPTRCEINVKQGNIDIPSTTGSCDFGNIPRTFYQTIGFTIENTGKDPLVLRGFPYIEISGLDATSFTANTSGMKQTINFGESTNFYIKFNPVELGEKTALVSIANNDTDENPYTFKITGTCTPTAPEIHVMQGSTDIMCNTGSYQFNDLKVGQSSSEISFTILNNGNEDLMLTGSAIKVETIGSDASQFIINQSAILQKIPMQSSTTFGVRFKPTTDGTKTVQISIPNNDSDENPYVFTISGKALPIPKIVVKLGTEVITNGVFDYSFDQTFIMESSQEVVFTIENAGSAILELNNSNELINITGTNASMFEVNLTATDANINPGESTTFGITFKPTSAGYKTATIKIDNNDESNNPFTFTVNGNCVQAEIDVRQGSNSIPSYTGNYNFGIIFLGSSSQEITFTIRNLSLGNLELNGSPKIAIQGSDPSQFIINDSATTSPILHNQSTTFGITFTPTSAGNKTAIISIANNDIDENPYTFTITGECQVSNPEINVRQNSTDIPCTTGSYTFTKTLVGSSSVEVIFMIQNTGNGDLNLTGSPKVEMTGADAAMFNLNQNDTTTPVPSSNYTVFKIIFSPTSIGKKSVTISIPNDDTDENPYTFTVNGEGYEQPYIWTKQIGGSTTDYFMSIATDSHGNKIMVGYFKGTVNFGADFGATDSKTSDNNSDDIFVTKINANDTYGWTKKIGGSSEDRAYDVAIDKNDNIYITGVYRLSVDFGKDFGVSDVKNYLGASESYVTKINPDGSYGWTKTFCSTSYEEGHCLTTDASGNIFATGYFSEAVNFGYDFGVTDTKRANSGAEIYVIKINANGTYGWTKQFGSSSLETPRDIITDASGNILVVGYFRNTIDFAKDFGGSDSKTAVAYDDIFVIKINANSTYGWTRVLGNSGYDRGFAVGCDSSGNVYIGGKFESTVNFGADFGVSDSRTATGTDSAFLMKITPSGSYGWTKLIDNYKSSTIYSMNIMANGDMYLYGTFGGAMDFGKEFGASDLVDSSLGGQFVTKVSTSGTYYWTYNFAGNPTQLGNAFTIDNNGYGYLAGHFPSTVNFGGPFGISDSKTSLGHYDIYLTKIKLP